MVVVVGWEGLNFWFSLVLQQLMCISTFFSLQENLLRSTLLRALVLKNQWKWFFGVRKRLSEKVQEERELTGSVG